jgi:hypothetical protein
VEDYKWTLMHVKKKQMCEKMCRREAEEKKKRTGDDESIAITEVVIDLFFMSYTQS